MTNSNKANRRVVIIAGEASGDAHGAKVAKELKAREPDIELYGMGSDHMHAVGVKLAVDCKDMAVIGFTAVLGKLPMYFKTLGAVKKMLRLLKPDLVILIDFPDFNMLLAKYAKKLNIPVLYYVSPQIWAWRQGRVKKIVKYVSHMAVILPFEEQFYRKYSMPVTYVGHPLLDRAFPTVAETLERTMPMHPVVGILPGSRNGEIRRLLDTMLKSAAEIHQKAPEIKFLLSQAPSVNTELFDDIIAQNAGVEVEVTTSVRELFARADVLIAASGTVTLEAGLHGLPMCIIYKVSLLNYILGRLLLKVKHIGLVNLVAGEGVMSELIQDEATPPKIAAEVLDIINNTKRYNYIKQTLVTLKQALGQGGAAQKVAAIAFKLMR